MVNRSKFLFVLLLILVLTYSCLLVPKSNCVSSSLTVEVRNEFTDGPIKGATVKISGQINRFATTDDFGKVRFDDVPSGIYNITVSVSDFPTTASHTIEVNGETTTFVLFGYTKAYFTYTPINPLVGETITFDANLSSTSANITGYSWNFGDGTTISTMNPIHIYSNPGSYPVSLTVTSTVGTATYTQLIDVTAAAQAPSIFPWILLIIPLLIPLILLLLRRKPHYVIIKARVPRGSPTHV